MSSLFSDPRGPKASPSAMSNAHNLTTPDGVAAYLVSTPYAAAEVYKLPGGHTGFTYRVILKHPRENGEKSVVVKHSLGYIASSEIVALSVERMTFEHEALESLSKSSLFTTERTVQVPRVIHYDPDTYTLIMTDLTPARLLSTVLIEACEAGTVQDVSAQIGAALGDFMGRFHRWGADPAQEGLRKRFLENETSLETVLRIQCYLMTSTAEKYDVKPDWIEEVVKQGMDDAKQGGSVIAMADFWFDNILVSFEPELRIYILDWETARCAGPELDVSRFAAATHSLAHIYPSSELKLMQCFMRSYNVHSTLDEVQLALSGARDVLSFGVMMPWIRHREDHIKEEIAKCGFELLEAGVKKDVDAIRKSIVVRDMFQ